jgi:hypothetical protein
VLGLLAQLGLLARQPLELALPLLWRRPPRGQLALLPAQLLLPPREVADAIGRTRHRFLPRRAVLGAVARLVGRPLLPLQLAVEERREVLRVAVAPSLPPAPADCA